MFVSYLHEVHIAVWTGLAFSHVLHKQQIFQDLPSGQLLDKYQWLHFFFCDRATREELH